MAERNALIVGASGGIGRALAQRLARRSESGRIFVTARDPAASPAVRELAASSPRIEALALDVCDGASIERAAEAVAERCERLHLVCVASGVLHDGDLRPEKRVEALRASSLERSFAVNAIGPLLVARAFFDRMRHDQRSVFAALSARVGSIEDNRIGGWYGYRASKAALNMGLRTFAIECERRAPNLLCAALHPGTVDTALSSPFQRGLPEGQLRSPDEAAEALLHVVDGLGAAEHGRLVAYDGTVLPW